MDTAINERLESVRLKLELNQNEFADGLGIKASTYSDIKNLRMGVSFNVRNQLDSIYGVNINWLITGEGTAFKDGSTTYYATGDNIVHKNQFKKVKGNVQYGDNSYAQAKEAATIDKLNDRVSYLESMLKSKESEIESLKMVIEILKSK